MFLSLKFSGDLYYLNKESFSSRLFASKNKYFLTQKVRHQYLIPEFLFPFFIFVFLPLKFSEDLYNLNKESFSNCLFAFKNKHFLTQLLFFLFCYNQTSSKP